MVIKPSDKVRQKILGNRAPDELKRTQTVQEIPDKIRRVFNQVKILDTYHSVFNFYLGRTKLPQTKMPALRWVSRKSGQSVPENAVVGGRDVDGSVIYVGRCFHEGDMIPAKVIADKNVAYVCHSGEEHPKHDYEVLCQGEFAWEFCSNGTVPFEAVAAGQTSDGERLYVGRVLHNGSQTIGKVQQSHGCLYIPFDGEELSFKDYEVLVIH